MPEPDRLVDAAGAFHRWLGPFQSQLPPDACPPVVVACSGGVDSLALLVMAAVAGLDPVAVHVDHQLRPGSTAEADSVAAAATHVGARFRAEQVTVDGGPGLEARARHARYAALEAARKAVGASVVLVGHTRDDQAETVLLHLLRGGATAGMAGMPARRGHLVRPLLDFARASTTEICAVAGLTPLDDPMNHDLAFRRVWLRREVLPFLEAGAGRDLRAVLARQASVMRDESDLLDELAAGALAAATAADGSLAVNSVAAWAPAVARRAMRRWLGQPPRSLDEIHAVLAVARGEHTACDLAGGDRIERTLGHLHRVPSAPGPATRRHEITVPGGGEAMGLRFEAWIERAPPVRWPDGRWACVLDAEAAGERLVVDAASVAPRFRPLGLDGSKTVSTVLAEAGIPPARRAGHPVVSRPDGEPLWVLGYGVGAPARVTAATRRYLWLRAEPAGESTTDDREEP